MKQPDSTTIQLRTSSTADYQAILNLLAECKLPIQDIEPGKQSFLIAENEGNVVGCAGLEVYGHTGLFRSLAVDSNYRNQHIGKLLTVEILVLGRGKGISEFYLLTTRAEGFFKKQDWIVTDRNEVTSEIRKSSEFASICPSTATCMKYIF